MSAELCLGGLRIQRKGALTPTHPLPHHPLPVQEECWHLPRDVIEESLAWIKDAHSGIGCKVPRMIKVHPPGGLGLKVTRSGGHQSAHGLPRAWPSLVTAANIKGFLEVLLTAATVATT